jgi:hypothetical protein
MKGGQKLQGLLGSQKETSDNDFSTSYAHGFVSTAVYSGLIAIADFLFAAGSHLQNMHPAGDVAIGSGVLAGRISISNYSQVPKARVGELAASMTGLAASMSPVIPFITSAPETALFIGGLRALEYCIGAAVGWLATGSTMWYKIPGITDEDTIDE